VPVSRLLLVRHGETAQNAGGRLSTAAPGGPLTRRGVAQAEALAARLAEIPLAAVYTSPLLRARQTARSIAAPHRLRPRSRDDLAEISAGELEGRADERAFAVLNRALDAWCRGEYGPRIGRDGDAGEEVCERFGRLVAEVSARHPRLPVALVSHGGLLQVGVSWLAENLPPGFALRRFIGNAGVVELEVSADGTRCLSWEGVRPAELMAR
jgi:broad specificity phosphatase PhoE